MKKYKIRNLFIELQKRLDARFGKGLCKAGVILMLFSCLSLSSCIDDKKAEIAEIPNTETPAPKQTAPPVKITITDTKQTAVPGDLKELYKDHLVVKDAYFAKKAAEAKEGQTTKTTYEKIDAAALNETVYVVVDTFNLGNAKVTLKILDKDGFIAKDKYGAITFLKSSTEGQFTSKVSHYEGDDQRFAIFEIALKGADDKETNEWIDKIGKSKDKKIKLCLQVDVPGKEDVIYCGNNPPDRKEGTDEKNVWLDQDGKWFELKAENGNLYLIIAGAMRTENNLIGDVIIQIEKEYFDGSRKAVNSFSAVAGGFGNGAPENGAYTVTNYSDRSPTGWYNRGMNHNNVGFSYNLNPEFSTGRTDLRIHPDGNNEGTLGCVGLSGNTEELTEFRTILNKSLNSNHIIRANIDITNNPNNNGRSGRRLPNVNE